MKLIPYNKQFIDKQDINGVVKVLKSSFITQGPILPKFEKKLAKKVKSKFAVGVNSATSGLHIACLALGLARNDYFWTVPNSYVSSANCGRFCGANVDFVDIDPNTLNICKTKLKQKLKTAKKKNRLPKILVVVHFAGNPCEMIEIRKLSKIYSFKIIEDASHALGSKYKNNPIGNCKYSEAVVFSFHPVKSITTAEGGMVMTNSKEISSKLKILRSNGVTRDKKNFTQGNFQTWKYEQHMLGYNYRMNEIQAALGISQLSKLNKFINKRNQIAKNYMQLIKNKFIKFQKIDKKNISSYHLMIIKIDLKKIDKTQTEVFNEFKKKKIGVNLHYFPIHQQPYYIKHIGKIKMTNAESYASNSLSLPIYYSMKKSEQIFIIKKINQIVSPKS